MSFSLLQLFFIFFYIGLFAVGGGLVAATFMQQILVEKYALISAEKFYSMLAISESTPGPIGINLATYIGNELYGIPGAIIVTLGEILPSLIVILIIAKFFSDYSKKPAVQCVFKTLRPTTAGMIVNALIPVFLIALIDVSGFKATGNIADLFVWKSVIFYAAALAVLYTTKLHPVVIVAAGALFGIFFL